jgi:uncharacterized protein
MESGLYEGSVVHHRTHPVAHRFRVPLFLLYLDLAELDRVFRGRWLWSTRRPALVRFRREDHLGDPAQPLDDAVRDLVQARSGRRPRGPVRLLTHPRSFGYGFNPVSLYYCFADDGRRLDALVAEVTNIPWRERHCYVLVPDGAAPAGGLRLCTPKELHVSPFMGMDVDYRWTVGVPGERLSLRIESHPSGTNAGSFFRASLALERREITGRALARTLLRYPAMSARVVANIYWQALRLRRKHAPFHPHPGRGAPHPSPLENPS